MQNISLIGIDLDKHSFHIHCQDKHGNALLRKSFPARSLPSSSPIVPSPLW